MVSKKLKKMKHKLLDFWRKMARSQYHRMSRGAEYISRIIPSAHKDEWRRKSSKK